jgi:hypothetical protein
MSDTEWKFVPVEPTDEMRAAAAICYGSDEDVYKFMIEAAPVPPSVESLLENWTPSDQKAFAKFRDEHFPGEMSSYAIQSLGSAWKDGQANAQPQPTAHLTIPGALEWDGDNGTHGADGESLAHGESSELERLRKKTALTMGVGCGAGQLFVHGDYESIKAAQAIVLEGERLRAQLANTEQSRRSFFDLSQDLEKRLAYMVEAMNQIVQVSSMYEKPFEIATLAIGELSAMVTAPKPYAAMSEAEADEFLSSFGGGGGNKAKRRIAAIEAAKQKTCIECDQPCCHGVCVERGERTDDRDQAAKGGDQ